MTGSQLVYVPLPKNSTTELNKLLTPLTPYSVKKPQIKKIHNAFVSHEGLVLKNGLIADGCAFNLKGTEDNTFYYPFWKITMEQYLVSKFGKSLPSLHLKGPQQYLLIHSKWFNYAFWINDFLPRLILAENEGWLKNSKLIVPEQWQHIPYVWESLKAFNVPMEIIPNGYHLFIDNLIMPETRKWTASFYPHHIQQTRERLVNEAKARCYSFTTDTQRIYLTRKKRGLRCVENEDEIIQTLEKYKFNVLTFEDLSIWEQILLMNNASCFVSLHGAGYSNIMFMKPGSSVLELINRPYAYQEYKFPFWKLANAINLNYFAQLCPITDKGKNLLSYAGDKNMDETDFLVNKNIEVDINELENNIILMTNDAL